MQQILTLVNLTVYKFHVSKFIKQKKVWKEIQDSYPPTGFWILNVLMNSQISCHLRNNMKKIIVNLDYFIVFLMEITKLEIKMSGGGLIYIFLRTPFQEIHV